MERKKGARKKEGYGERREGERRIEREEKKGTAEEKRRGGESVCLHGT